MSTHRDISPIGTSRFERPYSPPSGRTSNAASPTSPSDYNASLHHSKPSIISTTGTQSTAPTSIGTLEADLNCLSDQSCVVEEETETDEWLDKLPHGHDLIDDTDECPDGATLAAVQHIPVYDSEGNSRSFGSLYDPNTTSHQRQLIIFVRYFYCPACTLFLKALNQGITLHDYFRIPIPTSITIIGCGQPDLIKHYKNFTNCSFTVYADPSRELFKKLGMKPTWNIGRQRPEYMGDLSLLAGTREELKIIKKSLKDPEGLRKRDLLRAGNITQIGGEFLFENGEVLWCHRMTTYRNHAEVRYLRKLLQLDE